MSFGDVAIGSTDSFTGRSFGRAQRYNSLGLVKEIDHPFDNTGAGAVRKTVKQTYAYGLLQGVTGWATLSYKPNGLIQQVAHTGGVDEIWDDDPNSMARPQKIRAVKAGVTLWSTGAYKFDGSGNIEKIDNTSYHYDPFGRLASWRKENSSQSYDQTAILYDRYGNQIASTISGCTQTGSRWLCYAPVVLAVQYSGNRIVGYTYDAAGNVLVDGTGRTFAYDAFNMSVSASVAGREFRYIYDASDERVAAVERVPGSDGVRNRTTWTLRGFGNELLSIFSDDATTGTPVLAWKEDEIYRGSSLLGIDTPSGARHYALDHLGSPRMVTDASGNRLGEQHFAPFGDGGATGSGALQFTGHERDAAMIGGGAVGLPDYMHARFYDMASARFLAVDSHIGAPAAPQTWNRYTYARNNPLRLVDPDGNVEVEFKIRHFIPPSTIQLPHGRNTGDGRNFSLRANASVRTERTIRVETDPAVNPSGQVSIDTPRIGVSENLTFGVSGRASGSSMTANVARLPNGAGVLVTASQNESEGLPASMMAPQTSLFLTGMGGIRSTVNIVVSEDGATINVFGARSSFPAMEINATAGTQTFAIYRGNESPTPLGLGIFGTTSFDKECTANNGTYTCQ